MANLSIFSGMSRPSSIHLAVDAVVFGYNRESGLSVLLIKRKNPPFQGHWAIPGGFVAPEESLEAAVQRELEEETSLRIDYMEQLYTFGEPMRDPRQRVVSVTYFVLVKPESFEVKPQTDAEEADWFHIRELPKLAFDHAHILEVAISRLRNKITYEPVGFNLLEEKFTFPELLHLYETLLDRSLEPRNFRKKFKSLGLVVELKETRKPSGSGRPARLYRFNKERYFALKEQTQGLFFEL